MHIIHREMIYVYSGHRLRKTDTLRQALELEDESLRGQRPVVSAVGAGGKTTTLHRLAGEYVRERRPVIVTTTTHIRKEDSPWFLSGYSEEKTDRALETSYQAWVGEPAPEGKLGALPEEAFLEILTRGVPVLIEADGAKRKPLKVPAAHEPVIPVCTTHVLSLYGLDGVGKTIKDTVFRPELARNILNKNTTECVTAQDIAMLASSERAGRKGCPKSALYTVVLNKADNERLLGTALEICRALEEKGVQRIVVTGRSQIKALETDIRR